MNQQDIDLLISLYGEDVVNKLCTKKDKTVNAEIQKLQELQQQFRNITNGYKTKDEPKEISTDFAAEFLKAIGVQAEEQRKEEIAKRAEGLKGLLHIGLDSEIDPGIPSFVRGK